MLKNCMLLVITILLTSSCQQYAPFSFVQVCDTQLGMGGYEHDKKTFAQAVKQINELKPAFTVICGDLVHNANDKSFADFKKIRNGFVAPCYCAAGNHDVQNKPTAASLKYYRKHIGKDYYTFTHNDYTFIVVNTQLWVSPLEGETQKQDDWLVDELKKAKQKKSPTFIIAHYPLYTKTPNEKNNYYNIPIKIRTKLLKLYKDHGVIAVLAGHTHSRIINEYEGIQLVNGEATSRSKPALGFRFWNVDSPTSVNHKFIPLKVKFSRDGTLLK
jgi:serine/threonine-protein phosphatase CPPED1